MSLETAQREAGEYAGWMNAHGYTATVWMFSTALDNYGPESSRTRYAAGYAVQYAGRLVRDDGSMAEHPVAGVTVFCQDDQLSLDKLMEAGRAVVTFGESGTYEPYYVAGWNPRKSETQRDPSVNMGTLQTVQLKTLTPLIGGDGPKRFYDLQLTAVS